MRVVPANMDRNSYEKLSISESARSLKKYGSTSKHVNRNESYVKHYVGHTDTLQGIALKYDVTIEQIRRANRLWASDSLFLREYLLIPVPDSKTATPVSPPPDVVKSPTAATKQEDDSEDENLSRFLGKIDASIASTKEEVRKVQGNSEFVSGFNSASSSHTTNNNVFPTQQVTIVPNKGRKMKSSMQRLEQQQDEFFEL